MIAELWGGPRDGVILNIGESELVAGAFIAVPYWDASEWWDVPGTALQTRGIMRRTAIYELSEGWRRRDRQMFRYVKGGDR